MTDRPPSQQAREAARAAREQCWGPGWPEKDLERVAHAIQAFADAEVSRVKARIAERLCASCAGQWKHVEPKPYLVREDGGWFHAFINGGSPGPCAASAVWDEEE